MKHSAHNGNLQYHIGSTLLFQKHIACLFLQSHCLLAAVAMRGCRSIPAGLVWREIAALQAAMKASLEQWTSEVVTQRVLPGLLCFAPATSRPLSACHAVGAGCWLSHQTALLLIQREKQGCLLASLHADCEQQRAEGCWRLSLAVEAWGMIEAGLGQVLGYCGHPGQLRVAPSAAWAWAGRCRQGRRGCGGGPPPGLPLWGRPSPAGPCPCLPHCLGVSRAGLPRWRALGPCCLKSCFGGFCQPLSGGGHPQSSGGLIW